jgi:hypothetical protein
MPQEVTCPPPGRRRLWRHEQGSQMPVVTFGWSCPVTSEFFAGTDEADVRRRVAAHDCKGAGWCPIPAPTPRKAPRRPKGA